MSGDVRILAAIAALAALEVLVLAVMVGRARGRFGVPAPRTTGPPEFERIYRVHQNSVEQLIVFLPLLVVFSYYAHFWTAVALGVLFLAGRVLYAVGYIRAAEKREIGAGMTFFVNAVLALGGLAGLIVSFLR